MLVFVRWLASGWLLTCLVDWLFGVACAFLWWWCESKPYGPFRKSGDYLGLKRNYCQAHKRKLLDTVWWFLFFFWKILKVFFFFFSSLPTDFFLKCFKFFVLSMKRRVPYTLLFFYFVKKNVAFCHKGQQHVTQIISHNTKYVRCGFYCCLFT